MLNHILLLLLMFSSGIICSQDIGEHKWQNRVLIVLSENTSNDNWQRQLSAYTSCKEALIERKIILYQVLPDKYRVTISPGNEGDWQSSDKLFKRFKRSDSKIEIVLLGLDGGVKLRKNNKLDCQEISAVIDQMPMRRSEIRKTAGKQ